MKFSSIKGSCLAVLLLAGSRLAHADITVSGPISTEQKWSGIVTITGDVNIITGGKVTIAPGTKVQSIPNSDDQLSGKNVNRIEIVVAGGNLTANGSESSPIIFTSSTNNPQIGDWQGIIINSGIVNASYFTVQYANNGLENNLPGLFLAHCLFQKNQIGIVSNSSSNYFNMDCMLNSVYGFSLMNNSTVKVYQGNISNNASGVYVDYKTEIAIVNSKISSNLQYGLVGSGSVVIKNSNVNNNLSHGFIIFNGSGTWEVTNCQINDNGNVGIIKEGSNSSEGSILSIVHSNIRNNQVGISSLDVGIVKYSIISNNSLGGIYLGNASIISGNIVTGNQNYGLYVSSINTNVSNNIIRGNSVGLWANLSSEKPVVEPAVSNNNISENTQFDVKNESVTALLFVNKNYWGDITNVELQQNKPDLSKIYDSHDDSSKGQVVVRTYSSSPFDLPGHPGIVILGDISADGTVDITDAVISLQIVVGLINADEYQLIAGDMNNDDQITVEDSVAILQKIVGIDSLGFRV